MNYYLTAAQRTFAIVFDVFNEFHERRRSLALFTFSIRAVSAEKILALQAGEASACKINDKTIFRYKKSEKVKIHLQIELVRHPRHSREKRRPLTPRDSLKLQ